MVELWFDRPRGWVPGWLSAAMIDLSDRLRVVAVVLEMLRQRNGVWGRSPKMGREIPDAYGVRT